MMSNDGLDRRLTARLDERAAPRAPEGLSGAITEDVSGTNQRPAWATTERWISMETRAQFGAVPRAVIVFATLALLTLLTATAIAIGASNPPNLPPPFGPAGNGLIAFVSEGDIYVVESDGSGLKAITSGPEVEDIPTWSRDGSKLAYWTGPEGGTGDLVLIEADGENAVTVAHTSRPFSTLLWSADGREIMYDAIIPALISDSCPTDEGDDVACGSRLFVAAADGSGSRQVGDPGLTARSAVLSPSGKVAFGGGGATGSEALYLMDWSGALVERLDTGIPGGDVWPFSGQSWSPDGRRIATHDGNGTLWIVALDETGALQSVERLGAGYFPSYAPAGSEVMELFGKVYPDEQGGLAPADTGLGPQPGCGSTCPEGGHWSPDATQLVAIVGEDLEVFDRASGEMTVVATVETTPGLTGAFLDDAAQPSWQRVAP